MRGFYVGTGSNGLTYVSFAPGDESHRKAAYEAVKGLDDVSEYVECMFETRSSPDQATKHLIEQGLVEGSEEARVLFEFIIKERP